MALMTFRSALLPLLLLQLLGLASSDAGEADPAVRVHFVGADGTICGGTEIHNLIAGDSSEARVRNLPWAKVSSIATTFLTSQENKVKVLQTELDGLKAALADALARERPARMSKAQMETAISGAITAPGSFGSLALAQTTLCNGVAVKRGQPKPPADAYDKAVPAFQAAMEALMTGGNVRLEDGEEFIAVCEAFLHGSATDTSLSFCQEMCQAFSDDAQRISASTTPASTGGKSANDLAFEAEKKAQELATALAKLGECKQAKVDLEAFQLQLNGLNTNIKVEFAKVRDCSRALQEAQMELEDLSTDMGTKSTSLKSLDDALKGTGSKVEAAKALVGGLAEQTAGLKVAVQEAAGELRAADLEVKKAGDASAAAQDLRITLNALLLRVSRYFETAVRKPIRSLGLSEDVEVASYFPEAPEKLPEAEAARQSVISLRGFCDSASTQRALQAIKVGDTPAQALCEFEPADKVAEQIDGAVKKRATAVQESIKSVRNWLNKYHGLRGASEEKIKEYLQQGEPEGLREVMTPLQATKFYKGYLSLWKAGGMPGQLLATYVKLGQAVAASATKQAQVKENLEKLQAQLQETITKHAAATQALKDALDAQEVATETKSLAEAQYTQMQQEQAALEDTLARLKAAAAAANERYAAAKLALEQTHKQGTSLVELLRQLEREELPETLKEVSRHLGLVSDY